MKKLIVTLCVIGLIIMPSTMSINILNNKKLSQNSDIEYTTLISEFGTNNTLCNVTEVDSAGNIIWQLTDLNIPQDAERLPNGNTLITIHGYGYVMEVNRTGNIAWQKYGLNLPVDAERLPNGNTLITQYGKGRVTEFNELGEIVWEKSGLHKPFDAERLPNGNTLIAEGEIYPYGRVLEVDSAGNEIWNISNLDGPVDVERLYNETYGETTLITEHVGRNVTEFDENGEIIWQKTGLLMPKDAERLPSGNTLITECGANRVIEVTPNGENVWVKGDLKYPVDAERLPPPTIEIINPKEGYFHIRERPLFPFLKKTFVYGPTDIKLNISSYSGIEKVEFYINGKLKTTIYGEKNSYEYRWAPIICGTYTIKTIVYDYIGRSASDSIVLFKWRAHPIVILTSLLLFIGIIASVSQE